MSRRLKVMIGGSPCQKWSGAQTKNRETKPEGVGWELFKNYLVAKEKFKPDLFLYENNKSISPAIKEQISAELGVPFQTINSALVSAQNRWRCYWHNFGDVPQPIDRGIFLKDILEHGAAFHEKAYTLTATYNGATPQNTFGRHQREMVAEPVCLRMERTDEGKRLRKAYESGDISHGYNEYRQYAPRQDGKTNTLTTVQKDNLIAEPLPYRDKACCLRASAGEKQGQCNLIRHITSGGRYGYMGVPVRVGTAERKILNEHDSKGYRVYSPFGKSVTLCGNGGGMGAKTGLYAVPLNEANVTPFQEASYKVIDGAMVYVTDERIRQGDEHGTKQGKYVYLPTAKKTNVISAGQAHNEKILVPLDGATPKTIYRVGSGLIEIEGKPYPIKLPDGFYYIRKLTVTECCRLQTMPDDYCRAVSMTQALKGLGNGWTSEIIIHLLANGLKNVPKDAPITVLSMYDGIGTGRYCFDQMGFTNVEYHAYEIDKFAIQVASSNYPDIRQNGNAFQVRGGDWNIFGERAE